MRQVADLVAQMARARRDVVAAVAGLGGDQGAVRPAEGEWSLPEILEHLFLAERRRRPVARGCLAGGVGETAQDRVVHALVDH